VQDTKTNKEELVIENSKVPIKIGINLLIENCSKGEEKNIKQTRNNEKSKVWSK